MGVHIAVHASAYAAGSRPQVGEVVQNFGFHGLDGKAHQLSEFDGHYVLLEFWATWCEPCVHEIPVLKRAREVYAKRGLEILGMNSDRSPEKAQEFVARHQIPWPQSAPQSTKAFIQNDLKIKWYPTMILLNPPHTILLVSGNGKTPLNGDKLLEALGRLLPSSTP